jgi:flagellar motor switch protein FliN/FliY
MAKKQAGGPGQRHLPVAARAQQPTEASTTSALSGLGGVDVKVTLVLGRTEITIEEAAELGEKSLLRIDCKADDPVDVCVNGKVIARGRLVVVGENYGVEITEILEGSPREK